MESGERNGFWKTEGGNGTRKKRCRNLRTNRDGKWGRLLDSFDGAREWVGMFGGWGANESEMVSLSGAGAGTAGTVRNTRRIRKSGKSVIS